MRLNPPPDPRREVLAAFVRHLDPKTTRRYIHFIPKGKRATVESMPFEF